MIHRRAEGETTRNGINWTWNAYLQPEIILRIPLYWITVYIYVRRRSDHIYEKVKPRYICGFSYSVKGRDYNWLNRPK